MLRVFHEKPRPHVIACFYLLNALLFLTSRFQCRFSLRLFAFNEAVSENEQYWGGLCAFLFSHTAEKFT